MISTNSCLSPGLDIRPSTHILVFLLHPTQFGIAILFRNLKTLFQWSSPCSICFFHLSQIKIHYKNCHLYVWTWNDSHKGDKKNCSEHFYEFTPHSYCQSLRCMIMIIASITLLLEFLSDTSSLITLGMFLWPIFIETNILNELILSLSSYLLHNVKWERTDLLDCVNCNFVIKFPLPPLLQQIIVHLACADQNLKTQENIGCYSFHFMVTYCKWSDKMYLNW